MSTGDFIDIDEFMTDYVVQQKDNNMSKQKQPNYEVLLQSVTNLEKMIENTGSENIKDNVEKSGAEDLTADLFFNMSDSEIMSHFLPVRGIDYDQNYLLVDESLKKDKGKTVIMCDEVDELLPHQIIPNPLCQVNSAFKSVIPTKKQPLSKITDNKTKQKETVQVVQNSYIHAADVPPNRESKQTPRPIKKRKPRTYKYNPKPLQHKECRSFVPDDLKDIEYWERRKRNNEAAKKSREDRRRKELEILNSYEMMKNEYSQIKIENIRLKARNLVLEKQVDELKIKLCPGSSPTVD